MQSITPLDFYRFHGRLQPFRYLYGLDVCRYLEYSWTANALQPLAGRRALDVGASRSPLTILLAGQGAAVTALDLDPLVMDLPTMATRAAMTGAARNITPRLHDARALPYADAHFARVCAVSVLEHIPEDGDSIVAREMARALAPGGLLALTLPYGRSYRPPGEGPAQERFQRIYDGAALNARVIEPTGLEIVRREFFGVRVPLLFALLHGPTTKRFSRMFTGWVNAVMPSRIYGFLTADEVDKAGGVCLLLRKPQTEE